MKKFSLETFEHLAYSRQHEPAARELTKLLDTLDRTYGVLEGLAAKPLLSVQPDEVDLHIVTRIAGAISALFSDPTFYLSPNGSSQLIAWHRWISAIFAASSFRNADYVIRAFNKNKGDLDNITFDDHRNVVKFCLLYSSESEISLNMDALWGYDKRLAASLVFALLSSRFMGSVAAHKKREVLLGWLPARLQEIGDLGRLPAIMHDVYMHCSYADRPDRHEIKRSLNALVRKKLLQRGLTDLPAPPPVAAGTKPVMLVVLEWFYATHSVYRVLSPSLRAMRENFYLIGMGIPAGVDEAGKNVFDEYRSIEVEGKRPLNMVAQIRDLAAERNVQVLYLPAVGMFPLTIFLSNLRLAPVQVTALGHAASTLSPFIDYFAVDEDFVGDPATFSETVLALPVDATPFVPSASRPDNLTPQLRERPRPVRIAVAAATMKLNPRFLLACQRIAQTASTPVHFEFMVGQAHGLVWLQVQHVIKHFLGDTCTVHRHKPYPQYLVQLSECDMFINPFPYGNMNGIADMAMLGLVGVCKSGPQLHEHIDDGLFRRLDMPEWTIAQTVKDYVAAAVRLADNHEERLQWRKSLLAAHAVDKLYRGRPEILGQELLKILQQRKMA